MMREIKFRGKDIITSKWLYGSYIYQPVFACCFPQDGRTPPKETATRIYLPETFDDAAKICSVDPTTVGRYTGLRDRDFRTGSARREGQQINLNYQTGGQLNPDWVEELMGFPEGWTNPDVDEPRPWRGWPAPMGARLWMTPQAGACGMTSRTTGRPLEKSTHLQAQVYCAETRMWGTSSASDCQGSHGGGQGKSLRTDISDVKHGLVSDQYPYEFPRTVKGGKNRAARIKALGNAVVPQQAYPFFRAIAEMDELIRDKEDIAS